MGEFKIRKEDKGFYKFLTRAVRIFKKPADIINTTGEPLAHKAIFAANHCGAKGPFNLTCGFRKLGHNAMIWSAYETGGSFRERWNYLYHVFYRQKLHYGKVKSWLLASILAPIYKLVFGYAGLLPVFKGTRIKKTYDYTMRVLDEDVSVVIFPEDSSKGYEELPKEFFRGFLVAAKIYLQKTGEDVPVYPMYYACSRKKAYVGDPLFYGELAGQMNETDMCRLFLDRIRELAIKYGDKSDVEPTPAPIFIGDVQNA